MKAGTQGRASARPAGRMEQLEMYAALERRRVVCLVGCGASKESKPVAAKELYIGNLFRAARLYAERRSDAWRILSARYGLLNPDRRVEPYNMKLCNGERQRAFWGQIAASGLVYEMKSKHLEVICLAGADYADPVCGVLESWGIPCSQPLRGLQVGERLAWFREQREREVRR